MVAQKPRVNSRATVISADARPNPMAASVLDWGAGRYPSGTRPSARAHAAKSGARGTLPHMPLAGWCFLVALFAELGGVALIVMEAIRMRHLMRRWHEFNP